MKQKNYGVHERKDCGAQYSLEFTENESLPYLVCSGCGHQVRDWINWHEKYKDVWRDEARWSEPADALVCVLGYFCDKYRSYYGFDYVLSLGPSGLFRGAEGVFVRRILAEFNNVPTDVRLYVDWFFQSKVEARKKKITSMSVLVAPANIAQYKHARAAAKIINRSTKLPQAMKNWLEVNAPTVLQMAELDDYGDLATLLMSVRLMSGPPHPHMEKFIAQLKTKNIVDGELNIRGFKQ